MRAIAVKDVFDLAVIGGGLTGGVLFLALTKIFDKHDMSIILCEKEPLSAKRGQDRRVLALTDGGSRILKNFGLWQDVAEKSYRIDSLAMSFDGKETIVHARDMGLALMGYTVPYSVFSEAINKRLMGLQSKRFVIRSPFVWKDLNFDESCNIIGDGKNLIKARYLVGAQGRQANLGAIDYDELGQGNAVVTTVRVTGAVPHRGYWFGDRTGNFLALIPRADGEEKFFTAVLTPSALTNDYEELLYSLSKHFIVRVDDEFQVFPLRYYQAKERLKGSLVLLGNVAYSAPPLGGQNYNLTLFTIYKFHTLFARHISRGFQDKAFLREFIQETEKEVFLRIRGSCYLDRLLRETHYKKMKNIFTGFSLVKNPLFRRIVGSDWV